MMNGIDTIIQRLNTDAKAETDALLEKARQEAAAVAARYQAQADKEVADLAARNERLAAEREERLISAAQMEARKTVLAAKQAVMEETYAKALEKLRNLPEARYVEVLTELLLQAAPHGMGEVLFSAQDRETVGQAAVDAANGKSGGKLTLSGETAPIQGASSSGTATLRSTVPLIRWFVCRRRKRRDRWLSGCSAEGRSYLG